MAPSSDPSTEALRREIERRIQTTCLLIIATVAIGAGLYWLRSVMIPFVLALFIVQVLTPVIGFLMHRLRTPRWVAIILTIVLAFMGLSLLWGLVSTSVSQMTQNSRNYQANFDRMIDKVEEWSISLLGADEEAVDDAATADDPPDPEAGGDADPLADAADDGEVTDEDALAVLPAAGTTEIDDAALPGGPDEVGALAVPPPAERNAGAAPAKRRFSPLALFPDGTLQGTVMSVTGAITSLLSQGAVVLIFVLFMLAGGHKRATGLRGEAEARVQRYLATKVIVSAITGVLVGLTLTILGVDLALVFGLFAFLLNFIPSLGSLVATLLPLPVVLVSPDSTPVTIVLAIAIPGGIQFAVGNVIEPKIMGESLDLNPIVILLSLILWGMMWGIVGMLLAVPITAVMKIYLERLEITRPVAGLLGNTKRPPPSPAT